MKIKLLSAVLHDGDRAEAGKVANVDDELGESLIASGAAVEVEEIPDVPPALPMTFPGQGTGDQAPATPAGLALEPTPDALAPPLDAAANAPAEAAPAAAPVVEPEVEGKAETGKAKTGKAEGK